MSQHRTPTDNLTPTAPTNNPLAAVHPSGVPATINPPAPPRLRKIDRSLPSGQTIEDLIPKDHKVREVFRIVEEIIDVSELEAQIRAVENVPGRDATPPILLAALWIYATMDKVSEARELDRRCEEDDSYCWMCGGVTVNYHMLSDFLDDNSEWLDRQIARVVQALENEGFASFEEPCGQDGMRTRADAGSSSFHSKEGLEELAIEAEQRLLALAEIDEDESLSKAQKSAQKRAARERTERIALAQEAVEEVAAAKEKRKKGDGRNARASTTDPDARKMKMGDGGWRPAFNVEFATLLNSLVIVGVFVTSLSSDCDQGTPMMELLQETYGQTPHEVYMDGNFSTSPNIEGLANLKITTYSPVRHDVNQGPDPYARKRRDTEVMAEWRSRMSTPEAQEKYKQRSKCELPNAWCRNHGLGQFTVRGLEKVTVQSKWYVLAYDLERLMSLRRKAKEPAC